MTYYEFLEFIFTPISYFVNWLTSIANSLIHNYIFITFFGIVIFVSLFWFLIDWLLDYFHSKAYEYEDFNNLYDDYVKRQKVKYKYLDNHYSDLYSYNYKIRVMNEQVYNHVSNINKELLIANKINSLKINKEGLERFKNSTSIDNKIFTKWKDKETGQPLTKEEEKEINYLLEHF